jgi:ceramide glucosyltransferase
MIPVFGTCAVVYLAALLFKAAGATIAIRAQRSSVGTTKWRGTLTIVQPILSGDPRLAATLESNVATLRDARFLWLVDDEDEAGLVIAAEIARRHPTVCIDVVSCAPVPESTNPKTFKLDLALQRVSTELFLVLDDDATLDTAALARLVAGLDVADIATALPHYARDTKGPERLLAQFIDNNAASTYLALAPFVPAFALNGMCYATRTEALRASGCFAPIARELADDLALATRLRGAGWRIAQTTAPVAVATTIDSWTRYRRQMHRWFLFASLLFDAERPAIRVAIVVLHVVPPLALLTMTIVAVASLQPMLVIALLTICALRAVVIARLQRMATGRARHAVVASLLSELLQPLHLAHALVHREIRWRNRRYRVFGNADFRPVRR